MWYNNSVPYIICLNRMENIEVEESGIDIEELSNSSYKDRDESDLLVLFEDVPKMSHKGDNLDENLEGSSISDGSNSDDSIDSANFLTDPYSDDVHSGHRYV